MAKLLIPAIIMVVWSMAASMIVGMDNFVPIALYNVFTNPASWAELDMVMWVSGLLTIGATATVIIGSFFGVGELAVMSVIAGVFFSFIPVMYVVFQYVQALPIPAELANLIALLFVSPIIIATIVTIIEWWSNRD